jgi:hypothetical protein
MLTKNLLLFSALTCAAFTIADDSEYEKKGCAKCCNCSTLTVSGSATIKGPLTVNNSETVSGNLNVGGTTNVAGALNVATTTNIGAGLTVGGTEAVGGNLIVGDSVSASSFINATHRIAHCQWCTHVCRIFKYYSSAY